MRDENSHAAAVDAWLDRVGRGLSPLPLIGLFEAALCAIWKRTEATLGTLTLTAIAERVVRDAKAEFPVLSSLSLRSDGGVEWEKLRAEADQLDRESFEQALRFVMCELLTVLGNLTGEILTPELHAELQKVGPERAGE